MKESTLKFSVAESTISSSNLQSSRAAAICFITFSGEARSALVRTSTRLVGAFATRSATQASPRPIGFEASMRKHRTSTSLNSARALLLSSLPSESWGLCKPGVSTKTIWASSVRTTPSMRLRVVCATGDVMAILRPMQAFMSVDFPAFGRPTSATNPLLKPGCAAGAISPFSSSSTNASSSSSLMFSNGSNSSISAMFGSFLATGRFPLSYQVKARYLRTEIMRHHQPITPVPIGWFRGARGRGRIR